MDKELKPCPFCGGKAKFKVCDPTGVKCTDVGVEWFMGKRMTHCIIQCEKCGTRTRTYSIKSRLFDAWQRRTNDEKTEGMVNKND